MNYLELKNILLKRISLSRVKHILKPSAKGRPSLKVILWLESEYKVPAKAWQDIRAWLKEQEKKELAKAEKKALKKAKQKAEREAKTKVDKCHCE